MGWVGVVRIACARPSVSLRRSPPYSSPLEGPSHAHQPPTHPPTRPPNHGSRLLGNLKYVVVDEGHAYRGAFGAHAALVLRRLRRLCDRAYGSQV